MITTELRGRGHSKGGQRKMRTLEEEERGKERGEREDGRMGGGSMDGGKRRYERDNGNMCKGGRVGQGHMRQQC